MIEVYVAGSKKELHSDIKDATFFFVQKLMPRVKKLIIDVILIDNLTKDENLYGDCTYEDDNHRPREFTIRLDASVDFETMLDTLSHEMIHVKQYVRGELKELIRHPLMYKWKGKLFNCNDKSEPWEKEPYARSYELYEEWLLYK